MSDLIESINNYGSYTLPFFGLFLGLVGSGHCMGMCGPLVVVSAKTTIGKFQYHVGRLSGYLILTIVFSFLGEHFLDSLNTIARPLATITMGLMIVGVGISVFFDRSWEKLLPNKLGTLLSYPLKKAITLKNPSILGLSSIFLPCGLLYSVILTLLASSNMITVFFTVLLFWIGTLPALILGPQLIEAGLFSRLKKMPKLSGGLLIAIGIVALTMRNQPQMMSFIHSLH